MEVKAKLVAQAKAKLAPRSALKEEEGTLEEVKAAVEAAQIAGDAKQAAAAPQPAKNPEEVIPSGLATNGYASLDRIPSLSSSASSTDVRAMVKKAKLKPEAAAAPLKNAFKAVVGMDEEVKTAVAVAQIAGDAKQTAVQAAANVAEFETATGTATRRPAADSGLRVNAEKGWPFSGFSAATGGDVRENGPRCKRQTGCDGRKTLT